MSGSCRTLRRQTQSGTRPAPTYLVRNGWKWKSISHEVPAWAASGTRPRANGNSLQVPRKFPVQLIVSSTFARKGLRHNAAATY